MKSLINMRKEYTKLKKMCKNLDTNNLKDFIGKKVKVTKKCYDWYKENGEESGVAFDDLNFILKRPKGVIKDIRYDGFVDGFCITVEFKNQKTFRLGIEDIKEL